MTGNIMDKKRKQQLEEKGFRVGSAADFLELSPEEEAYIEIRLDISNMVKAQRVKRGWTQEQLARAIGSSQSRIAKLEGGNPGISIDLMFKALLRLGDRKSTRLNSSHVAISYAVFCLKKKTNKKYYM